MAQKCGLMPDGLGPIVQGLLGCICLGVLAYKCSIDRSGRGTVRFVFDSSKNLAGALWVHVANLIVAGVLGRGASAQGDACQWYFIEIMVDTTLGVYVEYKLLGALLVSLRDQGGVLAEVAGMMEAPCISLPDEPADAKAGASPATPGDGGRAQPLLQQLRQTDWKRDLQMLHAHLRKGRYAVQLISWLGVVTCMKFIMVILMLALAPQLQWAAACLLSWLTDPSAKLLVVMILTPAVMNSVQFWLQDNIFVDVAKWHDKAELARIAAGEMDDAEADHRGADGAVGAAQVRAAREQMEAMEHSVMERLKKCPDDEQLRQQVQEIFAQARLCSGLQEEQYRQIRADYELAKSDLNRRSQTGFFSDVVRALRKEDMYSPKFTVKAPMVKSGQYVVVMGEGSLGEWEPLKAVPLTTNAKKFPRFESDSVPLDKDRHMYQYKFAIMEEGTQRVVRMESGRCRTLCGGEYPPTAVFDKTSG
mmetsp:Transcript_125771/g.391669  ORF Transcript_125771/g.391669 Transcript_125771/m.391669 type:complete len:476 (-) Transcript_125771:329-1756(-)